MILTPAQIRSIVMFTVRGKIKERDEFVNQLKERYRDSQAHKVGKQKNKIE